MLRVQRRRQVNPRILEHGAGLDAFQRDQAIAMETGRVDAFAAGQVAGQFAQSLAELPAGAHRITTFCVMQCDRKVDEGLQRKGGAARAPGSTPLPRLRGTQKIAGY